MCKEDASGTNRIPLATKRRMQSITVARAGSAYDLTRDPDLTTKTHTNNAHDNRCKRHTHEYKATTENSPLINESAHTHTNELA